MVGRYNCKFNYYYGDIKTAEVSIDEGRVTTVKYTDDWMRLPFGSVKDKALTRRSIDLFYELHCIPEHRANLSDFLRHYGLEKWDAYKICRVTNGRMVDDLHWIEWVD